MTMRWKPSPYDAAKLKALAAGEPFWGWFYGYGLPWTVGGIEDAPFGYVMYFDNTNTILSVWIVG